MKRFLPLVLILASFAHAQDYGRGSSVGLHASMNAAAGGSVNMAINGEVQVGSDGTNVTIAKPIKLGAASNALANNTIDGADTGTFSVSGGGAAGTTRGGTVYLYGNEESTDPGDISLQAGAVTGGEVTFHTNALRRWIFTEAGDLQHDGTNGGIIRLTKASTSIAQRAESALTAAGTNLAGALQLTGVVHEVTTVGASSGVKLWTPTVGSTLIVRNGGANDLKLYPATTGQVINGNTAGNPITLTTAAKQIASCSYVASGRWICSVATGT